MKRFRGWLALARCNKHRAQDSIQLRIYNHFILNARYETNVDQHFVFLHTCQTVENGGMFLFSYEYVYSFIAFVYSIHFSLQTAMRL